MKTETLNLTRLLNLRKDRYAKAQGAFSLRDEFAYCGGPIQTWDFLRQLGGEQFRIAYLCADGKRRDMIGRQGVWQSSQDGTVEGTGHAMASRDGLTLSFWTCVFADAKMAAEYGIARGTEMTGEMLRKFLKVNTGTGVGYRTIRADRVLVINARGEQHVTNTGEEIIRLAMSL